MDSWKIECSLMLLILLIMMPIASGRYYQFSEEETGWTTGIRRNIDATFHIDGSSVGVGMYSRYTEMNFNDVRMKERIAADIGLLDTDESILVHSEAIEPVYDELRKLPGGQNWIYIVNETWPVHLRAARSIDYIGNEISDRESLGNSFDYVSSSFIHTTDLRKYRTCILDLENAQFELQLNDTTDTILKDLFLPAKSVDYYMISNSTGLATLRYRQVADDRTTAGESQKTYAGTFLIERRINIESPGRNITEEDPDWFHCCQLEGYNLTGLQMPMAV